MQARGCQQQLWGWQHLSWWEPLAQPQSVPPLCNAPFSRELTEGFFLSPGTEGRWVRAAWWLSMGPAGTVAERRRGGQAGRGGTWLQAVAVYLGREMVCVRSCPLGARPRTGEGNYLKGWIFLDCAVSGLKLFLKFYWTGKHLGSDSESIWLIQCCSCGRMQSSDSVINLITCLFNLS